MGNPLLPQDTEEQYILASSSVGTTLVSGTIACYVALTAALVLSLPEHTHQLGYLESQACFIAATMQLGALLLELFTKEEIRTHHTWTARSVGVVKFCSWATNLMLYAFPTPFVTDSMTGRPNAMLRWCEWTVLSFTMTFLIESSDSTSVRMPILVAASQSLSTFCGLLLPLCSSALTWSVVCFASFALYGVLFWRFWQREQTLQQLRLTLPPKSYGLRKAEVGADLFRKCVITWSIFVLIWSVDLVARCLVSGPFVTDYAFIADCTVDVLAKMLYAAIIQVSLRPVVGSGLLCARCTHGARTVHARCTVHCGATREAERATRLASAGEE